MNEVCERILLVDDDVGVLNGLRRTLHRDFTISVANSGAQALDLLTKDGPYAVVMTDYQMPHMKGTELLRSIRAQWPEIVTLMLTGQAELDVAISALHDGQVFRFLNKPCKPEMIKRSLRDALKQHRLIVSERMLRESLDEANRQLRLMNQELEDHVRDRTRTLRVLHGFVSKLNSIDHLDEVASLAACTASQLLGDCPTMLFAVDEDDPHQMVLIGWHGFDIHGQARRRARVVDSPYWRAVQQRRTIRVDGSHSTAGSVDSDQDSGDALAWVSTPAACVPLLSADGLVGMLLASRQGQPADFTDEDCASLEAVAESAATALSSQLRRDQRDEARDAIILALASLAEHRDPETGEHLQRVQIYCRLLCEDLARTPRYQDVIDAEFIEDVVRCSPLHDIGKVGIPDAILLKPGKLTSEEYEIMKRHARIGGDTIRSVIAKSRRQSLLEMGMEIAYYHHEKYDGSGYPFGLVGEAIPLSARIMAVADVYDALTSKRAYKAPIVHAEAAAIICDGEGSHFDPDIVAAFVRCEDGFQQISDRAAADSPKESAVSPAGNLPQDALIAK